MNEPTDTAGPTPATTSTADLVKDFFGSDPLRGEDASIELVRRQSTAAIETLIPLDGQPSLSTQSVARLKSLSQHLGPSIVPHLAHVIENGHWFAKLAAANCFAGFEDDPAIEAPLLRVLENSSGFDAKRAAVEALTHLGADNWAGALAAYATTGTWRPGRTLEGDSVSSYPFEKLSSFVLEALARFVANARSRERIDWLLRLLTEFIELRQRHLPNHWPDSYHLVARNTPHFTDWALDPMIELWGRSSNDKLRQLCVNALQRIASVRGAGFLVETAVDQRAPSALRTAASVALGELRHAGAADLLAETLQDPLADRSHLDWAFSTLYAVPAQWSGLERYADELLSGHNEVSARLAYSMALRGERRIEDSLVRRLDDDDPFQRWTAALALARLLGSESRRHLEGRAENASDDIERCGMLAAALRAGDESAAARLHSALQSVPLDFMQPVWQLELLDAFHAASRFDERLIRLWRTAAAINPRKLQYLEALPVAPAPSVRGVPHAAPAPGHRRKLFISYSHRDASWLQRFQIMLRPLLDTDHLEVWDDTRIVPGKWRGQIDGAMRESHVALFLVSAHFLASEFITRRELPELIRYASEERKVQILWCLLDDCLWEVSPLADYQGENPSQPLTLLSEGEQSRAIKKTCLRIRDLLPEATAN